MDKIGLSVREIDAKLASLPGGGALSGPHEEAHNFSCFLLSFLKEIFSSPTPPPYMVPACYVCVCI